MEPNETVKASTPLDSFRSHRFGYVITSKEYLPKKVMSTPYLHDKRIYLNRLKINTDYFYTSIESEVKDNSVPCDRIVEDLNRENIWKSLKTKSLRESINTDDSKTLHGHDHSRDSITSIICINLTEYKYYIYTQSGILVNRVNF